MERVAVDAIGPDDRRSGRRRLTDALDTTDVAINHYELAPGDAIGGGYHTHHDQEELFYVMEGTATFETEDGDVEIGPDEAIRFAPGEFQWGYNADDADGPLVALGIGAPRDGGEVEAVRECLDCGATFRHRRPTLIGEDRPDEVAVACPDCGGETHRIGRPDAD